MKRLLVLVGLLGALAAAVPSSALAYGGSQQVFELTVSANCDNAGSPLCAPPPAGFGLGGTWQWWELDGSSPSATTGVADGTITFCGRGGPAGHANVSDIPWSLVPLAQLPQGVFPSDGGRSATYILIGGGFAGIAWPAAPGHYSVRFGPGIQAQSTVVALH